jgi:hypothetical protein
VSASTTATYLEIKNMPNRRNELTIDSGWREVADTPREFLKRFV